MTTPHRSRGVSLVSWNVNGGPWRTHVEDLEVDVALLQEVVRPSLSEAGLEVVPSPDTASWHTTGWKTRPFRTAIVRLSDRVSLHPRPTGDLSDPDRSLLSVSRAGTLTAADVVVDGAVLFTAVSWYATWEHPPGSGELLGADTSAHRLLSDLGGLVNSSRGHRIVAAGDLNLLYGYGDYGNPYWARRYATVFDRADAMGLVMVGPQHPHGRPADPWPEELPPDSRNVPTYHTAAQGPAGATRQLDFVFASRAIADRVHVRALNEPDEWGPSDHCRIRIDVDLPT
ncbi:endonuclease/exonuclease/phosphatase family protein [Salsipaludibacter albus]|uniref:endonuclease/exonuclease/phosphatase family protein n=1 Tax=Salsipaludibacter albus TaxID=2849650 RepID=UPI001EE4219D|nr:endonuclease/exonuclease/phosphatase family protein [Salsipaludibacter albus]MBY5162103.1 endonuclease/exonuclease/phosphatase family protein [Salsipaludibacter albus]